MFRLYIDESGSNNLTNIDSKAPHFSIAGVIVHDNAEDFIKKRAEQIKFKYWGRTDVTFRGNNIRRLDGDFAIFRDDPIKRDDFYKDFQEYIRRCNFKFVCVTINKGKWTVNNPEIFNAITKGWDGQIRNFEKKLTKIIFEEVSKMYVCYLGKKKGNGRIIVEACNMNQDGDLLQIYNQFMFMGISSMGLSRSVVRERLTCISFATKNNMDNETQLADIGSHFISIQARVDDKTGYKTELSEFEKNIISIYLEKSFSDACHAEGLKSVRML
jgi:hypothetical protein